MFRWLHTSASFAGENQTGPLHPKVLDYGCQIKGPVPAPVRLRTAQTPGVGSCLSQAPPFTAGTMATAPVPGCYFSWCVQVTGGSPLAMPFCTLHFVQCHAHQLEPAAVACYLVMRTKKTPGSPQGIRWLCLPLGGVERMKGQVMGTPRAFKATSLA